MKRVTGCLLFAFAAILAGAVWPIREAVAEPDYEKMTKAHASALAELQQLRRENSWLREMFCTSRVT